MKVSLVLCLSVALFGYVQSSALRVVDGGEVEKNSIPYQAHLYLRTDFFSSKNCSGVLISARYVLTTSKCEWSGPTHVNVSLGTHNIRVYEDSQQTYETKSRWKIYHENFVYATMENNIALVRLPETATLNDKVQVATLAESDNVQVGQTGTISGWGVNGRGDQTVLRAAQVAVVENSVCAEAYPNTYIGPNIICVKGVNGGSACNEDGGAPLVIDGVVVGVYSGGPVYVTDSYIDDCSGKPNIFTKVSSYFDWIKGNSDL